MDNKHRNESMFELSERINHGDPFDNVDKCRIYDLDFRTSMIIPMQHIMKLIEPYCLKPNCKLLDLGCGSGLLSLRIAGKYPNTEVYGVETNDEFIKIIQENLIMANLVSYSGHFSYEWANYGNLPFEDNSVDIVFSLCSMHRWGNVEKALKEANRVCKTDGLILIYDLARDSDDGMISFILQYAGNRNEEFMTAMQSSYTKSEIETVLKEIGLSNWSITHEAANIIITSKPIDTSYQVGSPSIYENIFGE